MDDDLRVAALEAVQFVLESYPTTFENAVFKQLESMGIEWPDGADSPLDAAADALSGALSLL